MHFDNNPNNEPVIAITDDPHKGRIYAVRHNRQILLTTKDLTEAQALVDSIIDQQQQSHKSI